VVARAGRWSLDGEGSTVAGRRGRSAAADGRFGGIAGPSPPLDLLLRFTAAVLGVAGRAQNPEGTGPEPLPPAGTVASGMIEDGPGHTDAALFAIRAEGSFLQVLGTEPVPVLATLDVRSSKQRVAKAAGGQAAVKISLSVMDVSARQVLSELAKPESTDHRLAAAG